MAKISVVHITEAFSPLSETFFYNKIVGLHTLGHNSHVFTMRRVLECDRPYEFVTTLTLPTRWSLARIIPSLERKMGLLHEQEQLFRLARQQALTLLTAMRPDVIHAYFGPMGVLIAPVAKHLGIPLVVFFGGYDITRLPHHPRWKRLYARLVEQTASVICNSGFVAGKLIELGFDPQRIHRFIGVDLEHFVYSDPSKRFDDIRIDCLFVGRLEEVKSPIPLVKAFGIARRELKSSYDLHLTIVGDGSLRTELEIAIEKANLHDRVHVLGAIPHHEIRALMQTVHIYTQYNQKSREGEEEALGGSFLEASASGLPIIGVRSGGIEDAVIDGKTGYLVDEGDVYGMANQIVNLARHRELWGEFGRAGRDHVMANYTLENELNRTIELYEQLATHKTR